MTDSDPQEGLRAKGRRQLATLLEDCPLREPRGRRLLEIGFKNGYFLDAARAAGFDAVGTEIEPGYVHETRTRFPELELILCRDESIPLPDASIDAVVSFQVLEHVGNLDGVLDDCRRLLRPGGVMYHICPNYHSFYEGHYRVLWQPWFGRRLGRTWLRLRGKYTPYYEGLNLVTPGRLRRWCARHADQIDLLSLGRAEFARRLDATQADKIQQPALRRLAHVLARHRALAAPLVGALAALDLYYPITFIARRR